MTNVANAQPSGKTFRVLFGFVTLRLTASWNPVMIRLKVPRVSFRDVYRTWDLVHQYLGGL